MITLSKKPDFPFLARSVLSSSNGRVFINFQQPISVREYFNQQQQTDRSVHHTVPMHQFGVTESESATMKRLAYEIVERQQDGLVVGLWPLVCLEVGRMLAYTDDMKHGIKIYVSKHQCIGFCKFITWKFINQRR